MTKYNIKKITGGVTAAKGFKAASTAAGIRKSDRLDMAMIFCEVPAVTALVTTQNMVKAAPVIWDAEIVSKNPMKRAVVVNSGNANACTGELGLIHVQQTAEKAAELLHIQSEEVIVSSTGVIGVPLPIEHILSGIKVMAEDLKDTSEAADFASQAILTTDLVPKTCTLTVEIDGKIITIGGMAKGSGMICPNMATMLAYVTTDCAIEAQCLQNMIAEITNDTYNMMSVDGDMSTNDTLCVMASGLAENQMISEDCKDSEAYQAFYAALYEVNEILAKSIVRDGEGATKFIECQVDGAASDSDARIMAKACIQSSLVKTAIFGEDANWGRVLSSVGASGAIFDPMAVSVRFKSQLGEMLLLNHGTPMFFDEDKAAEILSEKEILILIDLDGGSGKATAWGCDLSYEYVRINGDYRT